MSFSFDQLIQASDVSAYIDANPSERDRVITSFKEMHCRIRPSIARGMSWLLDRLLPFVYDELDFSCADQLDIKEFSKTHRIVFVANHQSHADYVVFNYLLFKNFGIIPYTAGGVNLNFFPLGHLFRSLGCLFIRRRFATDEGYKLALRAYLKQIVKTGEHPLEFYYEGGRSRNGMLLTPKFGLFQMIISIQRELMQHPHTRKQGKPLAFIPAAIVHDRLPEQTSLARETEGTKSKTPEGVLQLLRLPKVLTKRLGKVHVRLGKPILYREKGQALRRATQDIAFDAYRSVGREVPLTAIALCSSILLDGPVGWMTATWVIKRAREILSYCKFAGIPLVKNLAGDQIEPEIVDCLAFLTEGGFLEKDLSMEGGPEAYTIREKKRVELAYFKNTISHHFLTPFLIYLVWLRLSEKKLSSVSDLETFILDRRKELKYEFYIPARDDMVARAIAASSFFLGRSVSGLADCFTLSEGELAMIGIRLASYGNFFRYKYETYYIAGLTLYRFGSRVFSENDYLNLSRIVFSQQRKSGQIIKYPESYSTPALKNAFSYMKNIGILHQDCGEFRVSEREQVRDFVFRFANDLLKIYEMNLKNSLDI